MKILLTAFEPFGDLEINSSQQLFNEVKSNVIKKLLPVSYQRARFELLKAIDEYQPDFVLSLGMSSGDKMLRLEKIGLNYTRGSIPDNDGDLRLKGNICDGDLAIQTNIDIEELNDKLNTITKCYLSLSAGGYICNTVYYSALNKMNGNALFLHLPLFNDNTIKLEDALKAVMEIIDFIKK